jgi:hypothetical protein
MSLLNDALKQARQSQQQNPPSAQPPLRPVAPAPRGGADWFLPLAVVALVGAAAFFIWLGLTRHKTPPAKAPELPLTQPAPQIVPPAPPAPPKPVVVPAVSNIVAAVPSNLPPPKLQGIVYGQKSWAIVDGKTVYVGDSVGNFHVKEISPNSITLESPDGSLQKVRLGE